MMEQFQQIQGQMEAIKQQLGQLQTTGESGAGLVKVTVNGNKHVLQVDIDPSLLQPSEKHLLQDLVVAASNAALQAIDNQIKEVLQNKAMGMLGQLPTNWL